MSAKKITHYTHHDHELFKTARRKPGHRRYGDRDVRLCAIHGVVMERFVPARGWNYRLVCPKCHKAAQPVNRAALAGKRKKRDRRGQTRPR